MSYFCKWIFDFQ